MRYDRYDLIFSSFSGHPLYRDDWGATVGGKPIIVKRARFAPFEGLYYLMPRMEDGTVDAALCLAKADIEYLRDDGEFMRWAEYVG